MNDNTKKLLFNLPAWGLGAFMLLASYPKLIGAEQLLENFKNWGYPDWFHYPIGALELLGGIGLFLPKFRKWAALGIIGLMMGAVYTHVVPEAMPSKSLAAIGVILAAVVVIILNKKQASL